MPIPENRVSRASEASLTRRFLAALAPLFLALSGALAPALLPAAEIDSVTTRRVELDDSLQAINAIFNRRMQEGVARANARQSDFAAMDPGEFCDQDLLYSELRKAIFDAFLPRWGLRGYDLDRQMREQLAQHSYSLSLNDSIYRDIDYLEGLSLRLKELSDVVRIDGQLVGLDKIGHFFAEGWAYFERTREDGETLLDAMGWGSRQEAGKFGYATTGIYSFADLTANFNGWRFWNNVLRSGDDPLKGMLANLFSAPYVRCELRLLDSMRHAKRVRAWRVVRPFDLADYVDGAWDEGNNCNSYADPVIEAKVDSRTAEAYPGFSCPIDPGACHQARARYGRFARHLLHPLCLAPRSP